MSFCDDSWQEENKLSYTIIHSLKLQLCSGKMLYSGATWILNHQHHHCAVLAKISICS